ncbi:MAG TPA: hypothetical protein VF669_21610 [Tepidisphaeraceae bacterium]|jgi:hypothetical protein
MRKLFIVAVAGLMVGCQQKNQRREQVWDLRNQGQNQNAPATMPAADAPTRMTHGVTQAPKDSPYQTVKVRFRRDALGLSGGNMAVPMMSDGTANWQTTISGEMVDMSGEWVVIRSGKQRFSIPVSSILMIEWVNK